MSGRAPVVPRGSPIQVRFWALVDKSGGHDRCWPWQRAVDKDGYGKVQIAGRTERATRVAFRLAHDREPNGLVLHSCDNPTCCNPVHLSEGTQLRNRREAAERGRTARAGSHWARLYPELVKRGEAHVNARTTQAQVNAIRFLHGIGLSGPDSAMATGTALSVVYSVRQGRSWRSP